jgi:hypothetical protein
MRSFRGTNSRLELQNLCPIVSNSWHPGSQTVSLRVTHAEGRSIEAIGVKPISHNIGCLQLRLAILNKVVPPFTMLKALHHISQRGSKRSNYQPTFKDEREQVTF